MKINGLDCNLHEPKDYSASILMCCGFRGNKDMEHRIIRANTFAEAGFRVLRWDYRSETSKQPTKSLTEDLTDTLSLVDWLGDTVGVFGESWGGQMALQAGARNNKVKTVVARVPSTDFEYFKNHSESRYYYLCAPNLIEDMARYNTYKDVLKRKVPTLIFSGTRDTSCPLEYHKKLFQLLPEPKKHVIFDEPHDWFETPNNEKVTSISLDWFKQYL